MAITIEALIRYPVKGLSGQSLQSVSLAAGHGFPCDREFGFARPNSGFDPDNPMPLPKTKFYMLARDASLALLNTAYDERSGVLSMRAPNASGEFEILTDAGKQAANEWLKSYLSLPDDETPHLYQAAPHRFTDVSVVSEEMMNAISLINRDSVQAFADAIGHPIDANRFRGNIQVSGLPPFAELERVDQSFAIGSARFKIVKRTRRCPATEVDLTTGERDLKVPRLLREHYNHMDMGVYAEVIEGGTISTGDKMEFI